MKKIISYTALVGGVLFDTLGFCVTFSPSTTDAAGIHIGGNADLLLAFVNLGCFAIGGLLLWIAVKLTPEPFGDIVNNDDCDEYDEPGAYDYYGEKTAEEYDYSAEFERLYKHIILDKVDRLIEEDGNESM